MSLQILHKDDVPLGGFAGLKEYRLIFDTKAGGNKELIAQYFYSFFHIFITL